jgi:hypothetical protein
MLRETRLADNGAPRSGGGGGGRAKGPILDRASTGCARRHCLQAARRHRLKQTTSLVMKGSPVRVRASAFSSWSQSEEQRRGRV